jgi:S-phase kinase-associated protein 1
MSLIESQKVKISVLNKTFEVDSVNVSEFLSAWLSGALKENEKLQVEIPIFKGITNAEVVIENIIKYMNITKGVIQPYPLKEGDKLQDEDFIDNYVKENGMIGLYEMMGYSNYLGIKSLLYLCCAKMALMIKDKSLEEIKTLVESGLAK